MAISSIFGPKEESATKSKVFKVLAWVVGVFSFFLILRIAAPSVFSFLIDIVWIMLLITLIVFFTLGILVIIGMRDEVNKILNILLEGSLTLIDFLNFLRRVWNQFIALLKDFLIFVAPVFSYVLAAIAYILLIYLYKWVGLKYDVTILTVVLTFLLVFLVGLLTKPRIGEAPDLSRWIQKFSIRVHEGFTDAVEVFLFVFFLTMDTVGLFFVPKEIDVAIRAQLGNYDLMVRSLSNDSFMIITLTILSIALGLEIIRTIIRIIFISNSFYTQMIESGAAETTRRIEVFKSAVRQAFAHLHNDIVKFIAFTTVLFSVFLVFPRLKLFTLVIASFTSIILDLLFRQRMLGEKGTDLISRILTKIFRL